MLVLMLPHVSSRVSGFPVASPCLWGKLQNLSFSKVSKQVVMSFCVAGAALWDIPTCLITCRRSFCVAGAILLRRFHKMSCSFRGRQHFGDLCLHFAWQAQHFSDVSHCLLHTPPFALHTPHSTPHFTPHTLHFTLHTLHFTPHTLHSTLYSLHSAFYTSQFPLHASHSTLYTPHFTLCTLNSTLYTLNVQNCVNKLFQKSVLHDCISMCFDIITINRRVSVRVRGLHLVQFFEGGHLSQLCMLIFISTPVGQTPIILV